MRLYVTDDLDVGVLFSHIYRKRHVQRGWSWKIEFRVVMYTNWRARMKDGGAGRRKCKLKVIFIAGYAFWRCDLMSGMDRM